MSITCPGWTSRRARLPLTLPGPGLSSSSGCRLRLGCAGSSGGASWRWLWSPTAVYAAGRSLHGETLNAGNVRVADAHGHELLHVEQRWGLAWELQVQSVFLAHHAFLRVVGGFYVGAHFVITVGVLVWLLFARPAHYRFWRTVLFTVTLSSTVVFLVWPALPPRLLPVGERTVDTLDVVGGLWSYNHGVLEHISDPYAPMPSLHLAWATWVLLAVWFALPARSRRARGLLLAYPAAVDFTVVVTGTHYVIDGVAGRRWWDCPSEPSRSPCGCTPRGRRALRWSQRPGPPTKPGQRSAEGVGRASGTGPFRGHACRRAASGGPGRASVGRGWRRWWLVDGEPGDHDVLVLVGDLLAAGLFLILAVSAGGWWWLLVAGWGGLSAAQGRLVLRSRAQAGAAGPPSG